jgi:hypothetical protein
MGCKPEPPKIPAGASGSHIAIGEWSRRRELSIFCVKPGEMIAQSQVWSGLHPTIAIEATGLQACCARLPTMEGRT